MTKMRQRISRGISNAPLFFALVVLSVVAISVIGTAQGQRQGGPPAGQGGPPPGPGGPPFGRPGGPFEAPRTARAAATMDATGYWVSIVTEDWRWRMMAPPKGDYQPIPLNAEGRKIADMWDPATDGASGDPCRNYGAPSVMRVPGRLHITWQDDQALKVETDAGMQTRLLHFGGSPGAGGDWQGVSQASWDFPPTGLGLPAGFPASIFPGAVRPSASLKVVTTKLKPGYLRNNGVPYSDKTTVTDYFDVVRHPSGATYLLLTSSVEDPAYLTAPYLTAVHFRKQADATGWSPSSCERAPGGPERLR